MLNKNNKSGYTGVCFDKSSNKWKAFADISRKRIHLGYYSELSDAIEARKSVQSLNEFENGSDRYKLIDFVLQKILYISKSTSNANYIEMREKLKNIFLNCLYDYYIKKEKNNNEVFSNYYINKALAEINDSSKQNMLSVIEENKRIDELVEKNETIRHISNGLTIKQIALITNSYQTAIYAKLLKEFE